MLIYLSSKIGENEAQYEQDFTNFVILFTTLFSCLFIGLLVSVIWL